MPAANRGSLVIVGTGIQFPSHLTHESRHRIQAAEKVLYVVGDHPTQRYIARLNTSAESLNHLYKAGKPRRETYQQMVEAIMAHVRDGLQVCAVFYGHPGVFVSPSHEAVRVARSEGYEACMLPGVSAEDCLFADIGIDPGESGCQSYEATDFLVHRRRFDPSSALILWQAGVIGVRDAPVDDHASSHINVLAEVLEANYGGEHEVFVYEASPYLIARPIVIRTTIGKLVEAGVTPMSTLYIPPKASVPDEEMLSRLGLAPDR